jgi:hypothetical protein
MSIAFVGLLHDQNAHSDTDDGHYASSSPPTCSQIPSRRTPGNQANEPGEPLKRQLGAEISDYLIGERREKQFFADGVVLTVLQP